MMVLLNIPTDYSYRAFINTVVSPCALHSIEQSPTIREYCAMCVCLPLDTLCERAQFVQRAHTHTHTVARNEKYKLYIAVGGCVCVCGGCVWRWCVLCSYTHNSRGTFARSLCAPGEALAAHPIRILLSSSRKHSEVFACVVAATEHQQNFQINPANWWA